MDGVKTFPCDPDKNVLCKARHKAGWCLVECKMTLHEEFAAKDMMGYWFIDADDCSSRMICNVCGNGVDAVTEFPFCPWCGNEKSGDVRLKKDGRWR